MSEHCGICGCLLHHRGDYAKPTAKGRSHATKHHYVAERFFGRSKNRPNTIREPIFLKYPYNIEKRYVLYCYECHEELIHNPVLLPDDIKRLNELMRIRGLTEKTKNYSRKKIAERIMLFHEALHLGIKNLLDSEKNKGHQH